MAKIPDAHPSGNEADIVPVDEATEKYVRDLVDRGEAAYLKPNAPLPKGVTHEIVGKTANGSLILRRRRFAAY